MKALFLAAVCLFSITASAFAQGTVTWNNRIVGSVDWRVGFSDGSFLSGSGYTAQLWLNGNATTISSTFRTGSAAGYFTSLGDVQVNGFAAGSFVNAQIRVWDNAGGTITSFDQATVRGQTHTVGMTLGGAGSPPTIAANLSGFNGATPGEAILVFPAVPEPSTYALGALGFGALLMFRRRKV